MKASCAIYAVLILQVTVTSTQTVNTTEKESASASEAVSTERTSSTIADRTTGDVSTTMSKLLNSTNQSDFSSRNFSSVSQPNTTEAPEFKRWFCYNGRVPHPKYLDRCCKTEYDRYTSRWAYGGYYLTTILERMQRWGCVQFEIECKRPTWPFSEYTKLVYHRFCNRAKLEEKCVDVVRKAAQGYGFIRRPSPAAEIASKQWPELIETLDSPKMHMSDLVKPCIQVALFDRKDGGVGRFHEIVEPYFPFCGLQWAGYDYHTAMNRDVSPWTGISLWCQGSIVLCIVIMVIACIATIVTNVTILAVFGVTAKLRNSQTIYKISVAIADLMVGLVVWPNMIAMQYMTFFKPRYMGKIVTHPSTVNDTWVAYFPFRNENLTHRFPGGSTRAIFTRSYVISAGFITTLGLVVSIYTLMVATFDRFLAVFRPLRYRKDRAKKQAKILCLVMWLLSFLISALPIGIDDLKYSITGSNFITSHGTVPIVLLFIGLILPLIITWVVTILTFNSTRKHARNRQKIVSGNPSDSLERRLAKTLSLMVGVFSLCILPAIINMVVGLTLPGTTWEVPTKLNISSTTAYTTAEYLAIIVLTSNSLWNFFIYSWRTRGFREAASSISKKVGDKTGMKYVHHGAMFIIHGARRISISSLVTARKFSSATETDLRKKSVSSLGTATSKLSDTVGSSGERPSIDMDSSSASIAQSTTSGGYSGTYVKSTFKGAKVSSAVEQRVGRKKQQAKDEEEYVGEDSTFGSFAVNAGTDRFFNSVMENVPEEFEDENVAAKTEKNETKESK